VKIQISGSDIEFDCQPDDTIMRAALRAGHGFPYECNVGSCGNCKFQLLDGEITTNSEDASGLSDKDKTRNRALGCQSRPTTDCTIKVRLDSMYHSDNSPMRSTGTLKHINDLTHDIREFTFSMNSEVKFRPGQYAILQVPGVEHQRAYSMSNIANGGNEWSFQIKRVPTGKGTNVLFDSVHIGDNLAFDGPFGMAYLREDSDRDILCLAGGSGLAPMISITRAAALNDRLAHRKIHFVYGGRTPADICGEQLLAELPGYDENISFYPVISDLNHADSKAWPGKSGFVHEATLELFKENLADFEIYFAGPPLMAEAVQKMLYENNVPLDQVHFDKFY